MLWFCKSLQWRNSHNIKMNDCRVLNRKSKTGSPITAVMVEAKVWDSDSQQRFKRFSQLWIFCCQQVIDWVWMEKVQWLRCSDLNCKSLSPKHASHGGSSSLEIRLAKKRPKNVGKNTFYVLGAHHSPQVIDLRVGFSTMLTIGRSPNWKIAIRARATTNSSMGVKYIWPCW